MVNSYRILIIYYIEPFSNLIYLTNIYSECSLWSYKNKLFFKFILHNLYQYNILYIIIIYSYYLL